MAVYFDSQAGEFAVCPENCPDCEEPLYDTGCDAPGCNARRCTGCGTGCDIESDPENGSCARALAAESGEDYAERVNAERAAFGLRPLTGEQEAVTPQAGTIIVSGGKSFDVCTAPGIRQELRDALSRHRSVAIDLENTEFADSAAFGVIVGAQRFAAGHDGEFFVICTREPILRLFRTMGLAEVTDIRDSATAARKEQVNG